MWLKIRFNFDYVRVEIPLRFVSRHVEQAVGYSNPGTLNQLPFIQKVKNLEDILSHLDHVKIQERECVEWREELKNLRKPSIFRGWELRKNCKGY